MKKTEIDYSVGFFDEYFEYDYLNEKRTIGYRCYYPSQEIKESSEKFITKVELDLVKMDNPQSPFISIYENLKDIDTETFEGLELFTDLSKYKVIIFNPGYNNIFSANISEVKHLVKNGYIVLTILRKGESYCTKAKDQFYARDKSITEPFLMELYNKMIELPEYDSKMLFMNTWSLESMSEYVRKCEIAEQRLMIWKEDIIQTFNKLCSISLEKNHFLFNSFHTDSYATFGNSFGGVASLMAALYDSRIKASINFDGWVFGGALQNEILKSNALFICNNKRYFEASCGVNNKNILNCVVPNVTNLMMNDLYILAYEEMKPFINLPNALPPKEMSVLFNDLILNFIDEHLSGKMNAFKVSLERYQEYFI